MQVLQGDGAQQPYRGRVFLGADGAPITFEVRAGIISRHASHRTVCALQRLTGPSIRRAASRLAMSGSMGVA